MNKAVWNRLRITRPVIAIAVLVALCCRGQVSALSRAAAARHASSAPASTATHADSGSVAANGGTSANSVDSASAAKATPGAPSVSNANVAIKSNEKAASLDAQIANLPSLQATNIDVTKRSADVRAHLNAVLRYYRSATVAIQKVGEPSDVLYAEQSESEATQIAELAFQAARNTAALLKKVSGANGSGPANGADSTNGKQDQSESERLNAIRSQGQARLNALQQQQMALQKQIATAKGSQRATLMQQLQQVEGGIELQQAMIEALGRINAFSQVQAQTGLAGDIDRLERSAPELLSKPVKTPAPPVLQSFGAARDSGVTTQASVLFQLMSTLHTLDGQIQAIDTLSKQADDLRQPFVKAIRSTIAQGQALSRQAVGVQDTGAGKGQNLADTHAQFDQITNTFQVLANATLPLSQEAVLLDNARGTLTTWRSTVNVEYKDLLRHLLLHVLFIAAALVVLLFLNRFLNRLSIKYIGDLRRRRHLVIVRRVVIGFLTGLVLIFGFVTQFSSLATFAGFITAGIAVGLQSILLSVAAYFFIVGRYGVKVGDRITVAGVTGEVIEVGLVRFYMMELVGTGTELHSTGRVAVFANSILFQTGTPIYKQMPGTEYAWHELTAKLNTNADVGATTDAILQSVEKVYSTYSERIVSQHQRVEDWMGTPLPAPKVESRLQLIDGTLQFAVLFPVQINDAATVDQSIAQELVNGVRAEGPLKAGVSELPTIKAAVKS